jgi:hypothetical protein
MYGPVTTDHKLKSNLDKKAMNGSRCGWLSVLVPVLLSHTGKHD